MDLDLSAPQAAYLYDLNTKYRAFVGGFGSGKTAVGCLDLALFACQYPKITQAYFGPTYGAVKDIFYPTLEEMVYPLGLTTPVRIGDQEVDLFYGRRYYGTIICRSMDNPDKIIGFKVARALVDEIDVLEAKKAERAWNKIIARLRLKVDGVINGVGVTTTPEGFKFVHKRFKKNPTQSYSMVQASTYENEKYLPDDYIATLRESYPAQLIDAYIEGEFVNLTSGTVYYAYDRRLCRSKETIQPKEPLYIGMDFNVTKMAATIYVHREEGGETIWHAVDEIVDGYDTAAVIQIIDERYRQPDKEHKITIYPDSSGGNSATNASTSDIGLLSKYSIRVKSTNPAVKDRVNAANTAFEKRRVRINDEKCPTTADCLEQQIYGKNGEPDKKSGNDHQNDATTYPIAYEMPIIRPLSRPDFKFQH